MKKWWFTSAVRVHTTYNCGRPMMSEFTILVFRFYLFHTTEISSYQLNELNFTNFLFLFLFWNCLIEHEIYLFLFMHWSYTLTTTWFRKRRKRYSIANKKVGNKNMNKCKFEFMRNHKTQNVKQTKMFRIWMCIFTNLWRFQFNITSIDSPSNYLSIVQLELFFAVFI